eukprot:CAMPEP_0172804650 /NCGR_PEP_ID=MMETSP1075-20121228/5314_1 /TAXON_ID=2916 /ORGANISM="Ceratium fusus, Strain PA161109" /LENGTH=537 /DNA_ID=CAMNT_0013643267 /DNA_START=45 /DNA_END=1655 /DNA_ORIENTATION=+
MANTHSNLSIADLKRRLAELGESIPRGLTEKSELLELVAEAERKYAKFAIVPLSATQAAGDAQQHEQECAEGARPEASGQPYSLGPARDDEISGHSDTNPEIVGSTVCRDPPDSAAALQFPLARQCDTISVLAEPGHIVDEFEAMDADINFAGAEDPEALSMGLGPLCSLRRNGSPSLTRTGLGNSKDAVLPQRWDEAARSLGEPSLLTGTDLCLEDELLARQIQQEADADDAQELFEHEQTAMPDGHGESFEQAHTGTAAPRRDLPAWRPAAPQRQHLGERVENNHAALQSDAALAMRLQMEADEEIARSVEQGERQGTDTNNTSMPESNARHNSGRNSRSSASRATNLRQQAFREEQRRNVHRQSFPSTVREEPRDAEDFNSRLWGISAEDGNSDAGANQLNQHHLPSRATLGIQRPAASRHQRRPEQQRPLRQPVRVQRRGASDVSSDASSHNSSDETNAVLRATAAEQRVQFAVPGARPAAVATATTTLRYRAGEGGGANNDDSCTICCEAFQEGESLRLLPCFHRYHEKCVD